MTKRSSRVLVGAVAALLLGGVAPPVASAQLPFPVPTEVQQVIDQAQAGSAQADPSVVTAARADDSGEAAGRRRRMVPEPSSKQASPRLESSI